MHLITTSEILTISAARHNFTFHFNLHISRLYLTQLSSAVNSYFENKQRSTVTEGYGLDNALKAV